MDAASGPAALVERLGCLFGSCGVVVSTRLGLVESIRDYCVNEPMSAMVRDYASYYGRLDLLRQAVVRSPAETILTTAIVAPWSELIRSEF